MHRFDYFLYWKIIFYIFWLLNQVFHCIIFIYFIVNIVVLGHKIKKIIVQEVGFFDNEKVGELINRMSSDTTLLQDVSTSNISMVLRFIVQIIASIIILFISSYKLTLIMLGIVPAVVMGAVVFGKFIKKISQKYQGNE